MTLLQTALIAAIAFALGTGLGLAIARWALKPDINPDRFWNGH